MDAKEISTIIQKREQDIMAANKSKITEIKKKQAEMARKKKEQEEKMAAAALQGSVRRRPRRLRSP